MAVKRYKQNDPEWATMYLGNTKYTMGRWGCLVTSITNLHTRFHRDSTLIPPDGAKTWKFTDDGLLIWSTDFPGMEFVKRGYGFPPREFFEENSTKEKGLVVQVDNYHWCMLHHYGALGPWLIDPLSGKLAPLRWLPYKTITGYALFHKKD